MSSPRISSSSAHNQASSCTELAPQVPVSELGTRLRTCGSAEGSRECSDASSRPQSPAGTVDSDESFQCRGLSWQYSPDLRISSTEAQSPPPSGGTGIDSDESFQCRGLSWLSHPELELRGGTPEAPINSASSGDETDSDESFQCRGLSWENLPDQLPRRPEPQPQGSKYSPSPIGRDEKKPRREKNFLGLSLDLREISNFNLKDDCKDEIKEASSPNLSSEMEPPGSTPELPASASSLSGWPIANPSGNIPMLGSSRLRTLRLEREQNRKNNRFRGLKEAFQKLLPTPLRPPLR